jgi:hypothetical protein
MTGSVKASVEPATDGVVQEPANGDPLVKKG